MKIFSVLVLLIVAHLSVESQMQTPITLEDPAFEEVFATQKPPVIKGKMINIPPSEATKLKVTVESNNVPGGFKKNTPVAADGTFELAFDEPFPYHQVNIEIEELYYAFLYVNSDLFIELDYSKAKKAELSGNDAGVRYMGTDGPLNIYSNQFSNYRRQDQGRLRSSVKSVPGVMFSRPDSPMAVINLILDSLTLIEQEFIAGNPSPYQWLLENERMSWYYGMVSFTHISHNMDSDMFEKIKAHQPYVMSVASSGYYSNLFEFLTSRKGYEVTASLDDFAKLPDLSDDEQRAIDSIRKLLARPASVQGGSDELSGYYERLEPRVGEIMSTKIAHRGVRILDSIFAPEKADILKLLIKTTADIQDRQIVHATVLPTLQTRWCRKLYAQQNQKLVSQIKLIDEAVSAAGPMDAAASITRTATATPFGASLYKISNMDANAFLAMLRKRFPGKAIILDRWATWCGPCIEAMPHSKKLQLESADLPVVFVYACSSVGSVETKWRDLIAELQLPGIHIYIDKKLDESLSEYFGFTAYPGYALINSRGEFDPGKLKHIEDVKDRAALKSLLK